MHLAPPPRCDGLSTLLKAAECQAWGDIYDSGNGWEQCTRTDPCNCSSARIGCGPGADGQIQVLSIVMVTAGLRGRIPPALSRLSGLVQLILSGNQLEGPIPGSLGNLVELQQLVLSHNHLRGPIPPSLTKLSRMAHLLLNCNQLNGTVPDLSFFPNLRTCDLTRTRATGAAGRTCDSLGLYGNNAFHCPLPAGATNCYSNCVGSPIAGVPSLDRILIYSSWSPTLIAIAMMLCCFASFSAVLSVLIEARLHLRAVGTWARGIVISTHTQESAHAHPLCGKTCTRAPLMPPRMACACFLPAEPTFPKHEEIVSKHETSILCPKTCTFKIACGQSVYKAI